MFDDFRAPMEFEADNDVAEEQSLTMTEIKSLYPDFWRTPCF